MTSQRSKHCTQWDGLFEWLVYAFCVVLVFFSVISSDTWLWFQVRPDPNLIDYNWIHVGSHCLCAIISAVVLLKTCIGYGKNTFINNGEESAGFDLRAAAFLPWSVCSFHQEMCHWSDEEWVFFVLNNQCPGHHLTIQPDQSHHPREEESCANPCCSRLISDHRNMERVGQSETVVTTATLKLLHSMCSPCSVPTKC